MKIELPKETAECLLQAFRDFAIENHYDIDNTWETNDRKFRLDKALYELQYALINAKEERHEEKQLKDC